MKNSGIKNLKVLGASLCLGAVLLTGCRETRISVGDSDIILEEGKTTGSISYENVDKWVKIISFEQDGVISNQLMSIYRSNYFNFSQGQFYLYRYYDLKKGVCLMKYYSYPTSSNKKDEYIIGESLNIIDEKSITPYLLYGDFVQKEYTVEELLAFFQEKVLPTLENNNKELVK